MSTFSYVQSGISALYLGIPLKNRTSVKNVFNDNENTTILNFFHSAYLFEKIQMTKDRTWNLQVHGIAWLFVFGKRVRAPLTEKLYLEAVWKEL